MHEGRGKDDEVLIVELPDNNNAFGEGTSRLERHHEQSGLGIDLVPQVSPTKLLELPGVKGNSPEKLKRRTSGSRDSSRS